MRQTTLSNASRLAQFIDSHNRVKGYPPNYREIRDELHLSGNASVILLLNRLERANMLARLTSPSGKRRERSLTIVPVTRHGAQEFRV